MEAYLYKVVKNRNLQGKHMSINALLIQRFNFADTGISVGQFTLLIFSVWWYVNIILGFFVELVHGPYRELRKIAAFLPPS